MLCLINPKLIRIMKNRHNKKNSKQQGFVLLFAVLVSTLVLSVGISVISIALKQVVLSGSGRDSQYAFYAANTGAECATYWDLASSSVFYTNSNPATKDLNIKCLGMRITDDDLPCAPAIGSDPGWCSSNVGGFYQTKFRIRYDNDGILEAERKPYCADVIVKKEIGADTLVSTTTVTSRGYNTCDATNPRRIERALEFSY